MAFFGAMSVNAQCNPDTQYTSPGIYPDSATNFAPACVNQPYTQLITNVVPQDTTTMIGPVPVTLSIDSIVLVSVTGLPPGMSIACNPSGCAYLGGTTGCAIITGTCATAGTYNLLFSLKAYVGGGGAATAQSFTLDYYKIVVSNCGTAGLGENSSSSFKMFPNPASGKVTIEGLGKQAIQNISLTNAEGKLIRTYDLIEGASMDINMESLNHGLYFVTINHGKGTEVLKLIKE